MYTTKELAEIAKHAVSMMVNDMQKIKTNSLVNRYNRKIIGKDMIEVISIYQSLNLDNIFSYRGEKK